MNIHPRMFHVMRWCWAWVTAHPHATIGQIRDAGQRYNLDEIDTAVYGLTRSGVLIRDKTGQRSAMYRVAEPFVIDAL